MIQGLHEMFHAKVMIAERRIEEKVSSGKAGSYEEYKSLCGKLGGLKEAKEIFNDACKCYAEVDEDE